VNYAHSNETGQVKTTITAEIETTGQQATTVIPPELGLPPFEWSWNVYPIIDWGPAFNPLLSGAAADLGLTMGQMNVAMAFANPLGFSSNFLAVVPNWRQAIGGILALFGT
jgi:hypothetical protein